MGSCKPNRNKRAHLKGPLSSYLNKGVEKENPNPRKFHKVFLLKLNLLLQKKEILLHFLFTFGFCNQIKSLAPTIKNLIGVSK